MQISDEEKFKKHTAGFESQTISPNVQSVYTANPFDNGGLHQLIVTGKPAVCLLNFSSSLICISTP